MGKATIKAITQLNSLPNKIKDSIKVKVIENVENKSKPGFNFIFSNDRGTSKIIAYAMKANAGKLSNELMVGGIYTIYGNIVKQLRTKGDKRKSTSTSKYFLFLNDGVSVTTVKAPKSNTHLTLLEAAAIRKPLIHEYKNVVFNSGSLYRYMGCVDCTKSIPVPNKDGKYYCTGCKKKSGPKKRKACFVIRDLRLIDENGILANGFVMYDKDCEKFLEKKSEDFLYDGEAREKLQSISGATLDLKLEVKRNRNPKFEQFSRIIKILKVLSRPATVQESSSEDNSNDDYEEDGENKYSFGKKKSLKNLKELVVKINCPENFERPHNLLANSFPLDSNPPGMVLVINNKNYPNSATPIREGSELDAKYITEFHTALGFKIFRGKCIEDVQNLEEFSNIIKNFKEAVIESGVDCLFLYIMSHGINNLIQLCGVDESEKNIYANLYTDVLAEFGEETGFPAFAGKPKIIVPASCQDFKSTDLHESKPIPETYANILVCLPAIPGQPSHRSGSRGTVFIHKLIEIFMNQGHEKHILQMLRKVQEVVQRTMRTYNRKCQIPLFFELIFNKDFYFPLLDAPQSRTEYNSRMETD